jgi:hypothetical protein
MTTETLLLVLMALLLLAIIGDVAYTLFIESMHANLRTELEQAQAYCVSVFEFNREIVRLAKEHDFTIEESPAEPPEFKRWLSDRKANANAA